MMITNKESKKSGALNTYDSAFELYKQVTPEKRKIASIIKKYVNVLPKHKVLDVGSAQGAVVKMVQPNLENITMVDIIDQDVSPCKYMKRPFQEIDPFELMGKYDLTIASHVWGHFYPGPSISESKPCYSEINKMYYSLKLGGHLAIVYNTNTGFFGELGKFARTLMPYSQINRFDEKLLVDPFIEHKRLKPKAEVYFNTVLQTKNMSELSDMCRIFFVNSDETFTTRRDMIKHYLDSNLYEPELVIEQKALILERIG